MPECHEGGATGNRSSLWRWKMEKIIVAMRGRYKSEGGGTAQKLEPQLSGLCNTLTSVQKDNLVLEVWDEDILCNSEIPKE